MDELFLQIAFVKGFKQALNTARVARDCKDSLESLIANLEVDLHTVSIPNQETLIKMKSAYDLLAD